MISKGMKVIFPRRTHQGCKDNLYIDSINTTLTYPFADTLAYFILPEDVFINLLRHGGRNLQFQLYLLFVVVSRPLLNPLFFEGHRPRSNTGNKPSISMI